MTGLSRRSVVHLQKLHAKRLGIRLLTTTIPILPSHPPPTIRRRGRNDQPMDDDDVRWILKAIAAGSGWLAVWEELELESRAVALLRAK